MPAYVGAIDQGTTSSRFIVFDRDGAMVSVAQREHAQIYPAPGHVEHDPEEIWRNTKAVIADALAAKGLAPSDLAAVGITNQRETTLLWDRRTGRPLHNALVWQDTRVDTLVAALARDGGKDRLRGKTGLPLASYFSGLKLKWLLDHVPEARAKAEAGDALFGTIDSWLVWNLTGGPGKGAPHHRRDECEPHAAHGPCDARLGRRDPRRCSASPRRACRTSGLRAKSMPCQRNRSPACRSPASSATSRRRSSGRPASRPARPRTPTAPAASC